MSYTQTQIPHSDQSQSFAIPSTNLEFASLCLRNAWTLVDFHASAFKARANAASAATLAADAEPAAMATATGSTSATQAPAQQPTKTATTTTADAPAPDEKSECNPSKPLSEHSMHNLRCAVLAASAYVQICLGEYLLALDYARKLSQLDQLPDVYA